MALIYVGDGTYIHGVPARDLSDDEEKRFGALIRQQEKSSGIKLYQKPEPPKVEPREDKS